MDNARADWERVGDRFYRKTRLYTGVFDPELALEDYVVVGAVYSGAVGMLLARQLNLRARADCAAKGSHLPR